MPVRFQLRRVKGYRKPEGGVVCTRPGKWGNPHVFKRVPALAGRFRPGGRASENHRRRLQCIAMFEDDLQRGRLGFTVDDVKRELAGKDLGCFCALGEPCHVDVLLRVANG